MGNQNKSRKNSTRTTSNIERTYDKNNPEQQIIDLDEIVEQWVWHMWNRTKTKSLSHYNREELIIKINWKQVVFTQSDTNFSGSLPIRLPKSQTLFRTNFNNKTTNEHSYLFKTERFSRSIFKFIFTQSLIKSQESSIIFRLPEEIIELGGGIKREQCIEFGQDTVKEYNMCWSVNSQIRVAPRTRIYAELCIDEEEYQGDFSICIQFYGRITATIATRQSPNIYLKFLDGDIVEIIREFMENNQRLNNFQIFDDKFFSFVQFIMHGKCSFRYGIEQHVILNQELLDSLSSSFTQNYISSNSSDYRPLRTHLTSSNNDIRLYIEDN